MLDENHKPRQTPVTLIHHAASCGSSTPPGSLSALAKCLDSGAAVIEIDILPLADCSFALLHDQHLEEATSGSGQAPKMKRDQIASLYYRVDGEVTDEKVGFLEEAVSLLRTHHKTQRLQLDLKPFTPLTRGVLRAFLNNLEPVIDRIQVSSVADWAVHSLAQFAPELSLGFDPLLYLDLEGDEPRPEEVPPFRVGAYGLRDDHPLSAYQWGSMGEYFAARAGALLTQAPRGCEWFIRADLLHMALEAGFHWIDFIHQQGSKVDAWTIDATHPEQVALAHSLVENGIDELTTDSPAQLAQHLPSGKIY